MPQKHVTICRYHLFLVPLHLSAKYTPSDLDILIGFTFENAHFALIEFKLGSSEIEEGANHLIELRDLIREYNKYEKQVPLREPDLMMVITGGQLAYTREDGVKVIPLACLRD